MGSLDDPVPPSAISQRSLSTINSPFVLSRLTSSILGDQVTEEPSAKPRELDSEEQALLAQLLAITHFPPAIEDQGVGLRDQLRNGELSKEELKWIVERQARLNNLIDDGVWKP